MTRLLRADFAHPPVETWIEWVRDRAPRAQLDVTGLLDDVREEYDAQTPTDGSGEGGSDGAAPDAR